MARCNKCLQSGLVWGQVRGKYRLHSGTTVHSCLEPTTPEMGRKSDEQIKFDNALDSRRMQLIGFRFNRTNTEEGIVDLILSGDYTYE